MPRLLLLPLLLAAVSASSSSSSGVISSVDAVTIGTGGLLESTYSDCKCQNLKQTSCAPQNVCIGSYNSYQQNEWIFGIFTADDTNQRVVATFYSDSACTTPIGGANGVQYTSYTEGCVPSRNTPGEWNGAVTACPAPNLNVLGTGFNNPVVEVTYADSNSCTANNLQTGTMFPAGVCIGTTTYASGVGTPSGVAITRTQATGGTYTLTEFTDTACTNQFVQFTSVPADTCQVGLNLRVEDAAYAKASTVGSGTPVGVSAVGLAPTWNQQCNSALPTSAFSIGALITTMAAAVLMNMNIL